jgi:CBS domain-containing protein
MTILDAVIPLESPQVLREELRKIAGLTVAELMSHDPLTVGPDTPASQVATMMVEHGYSIVPVLDGGTLLGAVTRSSLLRAAYPGAPGADLQG